MPRCSLWPFGFVFICGLFPSVMHLGAWARVREEELCSIARGPWARADLLSGIVALYPGGYSTWLYLFRDPASLWARFGCHAWLGSRSQNSEASCGVRVSDDGLHRARSRFETRHDAIASSMRSGVVSSWLFSQCSRARPRGGFRPRKRRFSISRARGSLVAACGSRAGASRTSKLHGYTLAGVSPPVASTHSTYSTELQQGAPCFRSRQTSPVG